MKRLSSSIAILVIGLLLLIASINPPSRIVHAQNCGYGPNQQPLPCPEENKKKTPIVYPSYTPTVTDTPIPQATDTPQPTETPVPPAPIPGDDSNPSPFARFFFGGGGGWLTGILIGILIGLLLPFILRSFFDMRPNAAVGKGTPGGGDDVFFKYDLASHTPGAEDAFHKHDPAPETSGAGELLPAVNLDGGIIAINKGGIVGSTDEAGIIAINQGGIVGPTDSHAAPGSPDLQVREAALNAREAALNVREAALSAREAASSAGDAFHKH